MLIVIWAVLHHRFESIDTAGKNFIDLFHFVECFFRLHENMNIIHCIMLDGSRWRSRMKLSSLKGYMFPPLHWCAKFMCELLKLQVIFVNDYLISTFSSKRTRVILGHTATAFTLKDCFTFKCIRGSCWDWKKICYFLSWLLYMRT